MGADFLSESAPERPSPPAPSSGGGGNVLTRKVGPLPTWAWLGIIAVGGGAVWLYARHRQSAASAAADTSSTGGASTGDCTDASGNSVPCDQADEGGQIATLQTELMDLEQEVSQLKTAGAVPPDQPPPAPAPKFYREVATGARSLSSVAKSRGTTAAHIEEVTRQSAGKPGGISSANLAKFNTYVAKGVTKKMPAGLIYYTSNPQTPFATTPPPPTGALQPGGPIQRT